MAAARRLQLLQEKKCHGNLASRLRPSLVAGGQPRRGQQGANGKAAAGDDELAAEDEAEADLGARLRRLRRGHHRHEG